MCAPAPGEKGLAAGLPISSSDPGPPGRGGDQVCNQIPPSPGCFFPVAPECTVRALHK